MHTAFGMNLHLAVASLLFCTSGIASEATVNAAQNRKPIAPTLYDSLGDEMHQAQLAASYGIDLSNPDLVKVALLGTLGQNSAGPVFSEGAPPPVVGPALALFTNYDGQGARFGNMAFATQGSNPLMSVFAAYDLDANVTVVLLNKSQTMPDSVVLGFKGTGQKGNWRAFELGADGQITPAGSGTIYDAVLTRTVQPFTALLVEYRPVGGILPVAESKEITLPAAQVVESDAAPQPAGCNSAGDAGVLSLAILGLLGLMRFRSHG